MRLGLYGGTFDPIHVGHLDVARAARHALALDELWLLPSRQPPHRGSPGASPAHRFAMAALAIENEDGLLVSDLEMEAAGPTYTVETLDRLAGRGIPLDTVYFTIGADAFRDIRIWKGFPGVLQRSHFIVVARPGLTASDAVRSVPEALDRLASPDAQPTRASVFAVDAKTMAVSSSEVRQAVAAGRPLHGLVPDAVARHIVRHGLYQPVAPLDNDGQGAA